MGIWEFGNPSWYFFLNGKIQGEMVEQPAGRSKFSLFNMEKNSKTNCGRKAQIPIIPEMAISKDK